MKTRDWVLLALVVLVLAVLFKSWTSPKEIVTSVWRVEGPPPWTGRVGDVVRWGETLWGWTETSQFTGWAVIGE